MTVLDQMISDASDPNIFADVTAFAEEIGYVAIGEAMVTIIATVSRREDYAVVDGPNGPTQMRKYTLHAAAVDVPNLTQGVNAGDGDVFVIDDKNWKVIGRPASDSAMMRVDVVNVRDTEMSAPGARIKY